jgi:hypothetical protein
MSLQVNLLKKSEQRYQGIVSMKVMVLTSAGVLLGVTVLVFTLAGISKMTLHANLDRARREWERIEPLAAVIRAKQDAYIANQKTLEELEVWSKGDHVGMSGVLRAVQSEIPARMELNGLYAGIETSVPAEKEKEEDYYVLRLNGRAQGELTAVDAKRQLNGDPEVRGFCGEVKLVSSQRDDGDVWNFSMEGRRPTGGGKK